MSAGSSDTKVGTVSNHPYVHLLVSEHPLCADTREARGQAWSLSPVSKYIHEGEPGGEADSPRLCWEDSRGTALAGSRTAQTEDAP